MHNNLEQCILFLIFNFFILIIGRFVQLSNKPQEAVFCADFRTFKGVFEKPLTCSKISAKHRLAGLIAFLKLLLQIFDMVS